MLLFLNEIHRAITNCRVVLQPKDPTQLKVCLITFYFNDTDLLFMYLLFLQLKIVREERNIFEPKVFSSIAVEAAKWFVVSGRWDEGFWSAEGAGPPLHCQW